MTEHILGQSLGFSPLTFTINGNNFQSVNVAVLAKPGSSCEFVNTVPGVATFQIPANSIQIHPIEIPTSNTIQEAEALPTITAITECSSPTKNQRDKRGRWRPNPSQKAILESIWASTPYPDATQKKEIAQMMQGVTYKQITSWFKHRREMEKARGVPLRTASTVKFTQEQLTVLESAFFADPYAKGQEVAVALNVPLKRVQTWFKHKRSRLKVGEKRIHPGSIESSWDEMHNMYSTQLDSTTNRKDQQIEPNESSSDDHFIFGLEPVLDEDQAERPKAVKNFETKKLKTSKLQEETELPLEPFDIFALRPVLPFDGEGHITDLEKVEKLPIPDPDVVQPS